MRKRNDSNVGSCPLPISGPDRSNGLRHRSFGKLWGIHVRLRSAQCMLLPRMSTQALLRERQGRNCGLPVLFLFADLPKTKRPKQLTAC